MHGTKDLLNTLSVTAPPLEPDSTATEPCDVPLRGPMFTIALEAGLLQAAAGDIIGSNISVPNEGKVTRINVQVEGPLTKRQRNDSRA